VYRGLYQLGDFVNLAVLTTDSAGLPAAPDAAPKVDIYDSSSVVVAGQGVPAIDRTIVTGLFGLRLPLDGKFSPGQYTAVYRWTVGAFSGQETDTFEVLPGGHPDGAVVAAFYLDKPHARFIVQQTDAGKIVRGRNPEVL
jgi:hypothetical protein